MKTRDQIVAKIEELKKFEKSDEFIARDPNPCESEAVWSFIEALEWVLE